MDSIKHIFSLEINKNLFKAVFSLKNVCSIANLKKKKRNKIKKAFIAITEEHNKPDSKEKREGGKHDCFTSEIYPFQQNQKPVLTASGEMAQPDPKNKGFY